MTRLEIGLTIVRWLLIAAIAVLAYVLEG